MLHKYFLLLCLAASALFGADLTGRWSGNVKMSLDGAEMEMPHEIVLKQQGDSISGTAGPGSDQQWPISNARLAGAELTFHVKAPDGGPTFEYKLVVEGAQMTGDYTMTMEGQVSTAKVAVKKK